MGGAAAAGAAAQYGDGDIQSYQGDDLNEFPCVYLDTNGLYDFKDLRNFQSDYQVASDFTDPESKSITFNFCKLISGCGSGNTFASVEVGG